MHSILKLGMVYPLPQNMIRKFAEQMERVIVLEELDPFIEHQVRSMGVTLYGVEPGAYPSAKSIFPITGELDLIAVRKAAEKAGLIAPSEQVEPAVTAQNLPSRVPVLCPGCPHRGAFFVLHKLGAPGEWRHRVLHAGGIPAIEIDRYLRVHGRQHRSGSRRGDCRRHRKARCGDWRFDVLPFRDSCADERGLQPQQRDHDHYG